MRKLGGVEPSGFFKLIKPIIVREGKKEWETSLATLKELLEATSALEEVLPEEASVNA
ncbi:MAG: hypothetical protein O7B30_05105 [Thaumarchaeota archaeon]|nr:hypothetical protein [Nitrososphaerota archaeon]